jgi:hypothetical protein
MCSICSHNTGASARTTGIFQMPADALGRSSSANTLIINGGGQNVLLALTSGAHSVIIRNQSCASRRMERRNIPLNRVCCGFFCESGNRTPRPLPAGCSTIFINIIYKQIKFLFYEVQINEAD